MNVIAGLIAAALEQSFPVLQEGGSHPPALAPLSLGAGTEQFSGRARPAMMYGTCQSPWG